jgi:WD domain, G-beta repeat
VGVLDVATGNWLRTSVDAHDLSVPSLGYAPDGDLLASGSSDGRVGLWDGGTGALLGTVLPGRANMAVSVSFLPDGHTVLIAGARVCDRWEEPLPRRMARRLRRPPLPPDLPRASRRQVANSAQQAGRAAEPVPPLRVQLPQVDEEGIVGGADERLATAPQRRDVR